MPIDLIRIFEPLMFMSFGLLLLLLTIVCANTYDKNETLYMKIISIIMTLTCLIMTLALFGVAIGGALYGFE